MQKGDVSMGSAPRMCWLKRCVSCERQHRGHRQCIICFQVGAAKVRRNVVDALVVASERRETRSTSMQSLVDLTDQDQPTIAKVSHFAGSPGGVLAVSLPDVYEL